MDSTQHPLLVAENNRKINNYSRGCLAGHHGVISIIVPGFKNGQAHPSCGRSGCGKSLDIIVHIPKRFGLLVGENRID